MDVEGGFYNPRLNTGLNVMTYAIKEWGIGNSAEDNLFKDWTFIGVPYCNGDFHAGTGEKEYTALDGSTKTIYYNGYTNYRRLMTEIFLAVAMNPDLENASVQKPNAFAPGVTPLRCLDKANRGKRRNDRNKAGIVISKDKL